MRIAELRLRFCAYALDALVMYIPIVSIAVSKPGLCFRPGYCSQGRCAPATSPKDCCGGRSFGLGRSKSQELIWKGTQTPLAQLRQSELKWIVYAEYSRTATLHKDGAVKFSVSFHSKALAQWSAFDAPQAGEKTADRVALTQHGKFNIQWCTWLQIQRDWEKTFSHLVLRKKTWKLAVVLIMSYWTEFCEMQIMVMQNLQNLCTAALFGPCVATGYVLGTSKISSTIRTWPFLVQILQEIQPFMAATLQISKKSSIFAVKTAADKLRVQCSVICVCASASVFFRRLWILGLVHSDLPYQVTGFLAAITILVCVADYVLAEMGGEKVSFSRVFQHGSRMMALMRLFLQNPGVMFQTFETHAFSSVIDTEIVAARIATDWNRVNHAQAVPSGGRSFLIETVTVLVCMPWP